MVRKTIGTGVNFFNGIVDKNIVSLFPWAVGPLVADQESMYVCCFGASMGGNIGAD